LVGEFLGFALRAAWGDPECASKLARIRKSSGLAKSFLKNGHEYCKNFIEN
jgi:hypothetical protein